MVKLMRNEKGFNLIEVIIAIALLGIIGVVILSALATASKAIFIADERATAESLARSQMEYVKSQDYIYYNVGGHAVYDEITPSDSNYSISFTVVPFDPVTGGDYTVTNPGDDIPIFDYDDGIQKITVTVEHLGKGVIITLEGYKVDR